MACMGIVVCSAVDAAQLLVILYLSKAEERGLLTSRQDMHEEILQELGNFWFSLLPKMPQVPIPEGGCCFCMSLHGISSFISGMSYHQLVLPIMLVLCRQTLRGKFVQLVSDMEKTTELVLPFRLAKTIALIDLSDLSEGEKS